MQFTKLVFILAVVVPLAGCANPPSPDIQRGLVGAAAGAVISDVTGGNAATGALIGGIGGMVCDDVGVCR